MGNIESKNILPGDGEDTNGKDNKNKEYKLNSTILHEEEAKKAREEIEGLNEKFKELIEASKKFIESSETKKEESDDQSS